MPATEAFTAFKVHKCVECECTIFRGEKAYALDYQLFCSRDCIATYQLLKEVM